MRDYSNLNDAIVLARSVAILKIVILNNGAHSFGRFIAVAWIRQTVPVQTRYIQAKFVVFAMS